MRRKLLIFIFASIVSSCAGLGNTFTTQVDPFSGDTVSVSNQSCSLGLCTKFRIINNSRAYLHIGYFGSDWLFVESIQIKIMDSSKKITLSGDFNREVIYGAI